MRRQNVIIFSSGKNLCVARSIAQQLDGERFQVVVWDMFFKKIYGEEYAQKKSYALFPFLVKKIPSFDYAIVVAGDDDRVLLNGQSDRAVVTARDNVIFELGLCAMALGEKRVIVVRHHSVRLIDDLRGLDAQATREDGSRQILTAQNVQLKTFDYTTLQDIPEIGAGIEGYVRETFEDYSPVVVGTACSTALGYRDNFLVPLVHGLKEHPEGERFSVKVVLPGESMLKQDREALRDPRQFVEKMFREECGMSTGSVACKGRPVHFCWRDEAEGIVIYDLPTTLLASRAVAEQVLSIQADDRIERDHLQRLMMKEVDQFAATLKKFLLRDDEGTCFVTEEDRRMNFCPINLCVYESDEG